VSPTRALAFGDLDGGLWAVGWSPSVHGPLSIAVGARSVAEVLAATLTGSAADEEWRLEGERIDLVLSPSARSAGSGARGGLEGFDQLCRAGGRITLDATELEVDVPGWRGAHDGQLALERIESFRHVAAWFGSDEGLALVALRPRGARGQDSDLVAASVLEPGRAPRVDDPRLSTTYTATGVPSKAGLELWFEEPETQDAEANGEQELLPRRAAGEAVGAGLDWNSAGFALHAAPLRWHSRGEDGRGVYLLGRRA
jgi:hypothetical protein